MEKRNLFVSGKAVVAAVCGAFTAAFGWLGWLVVAWAACMALDWVSGSAAADPVQRHAGGPRHNKPAQPAERCRERPAHRRHNGLAADKQISFLH